MEHSEKHVLITGAGVGIGRGIALAFAEAGYHVAIHCCGSYQKALAVKAEVEAMGRKAILLQEDLSKPGAAKRLFQKYEEAFPSLEVFVNNSGITRTAPFLETSEADFDAMTGLNFRGSYFCIQQAGQYFVRHNIRGSIVVISSNNDRAHFANASAYGAVKAALTKTAEHAAVELAAYGIRVNVIAPGWTDTGEARMGKMEDTYYKIPLKRWCKTDEIGKAAVFLSSEAAASITGCRLVMDGGALLLSDKGEKYGL